MYHVIMSSSFNSSDDMFVPFIPNINDIDNEIDGPLCKTASI